MQMFYTVNPDDTLYLIANRWQVPLPSLIAANQLVPPYIIFIGQQLSMPPGVTTYLVQPGDYLYRIAHRYSIPLASIIQANRLQPPYIIQPGQVLTIPEGVPYYVVQQGETLYEIAATFNVQTEGEIRPQLIRRVNQLPSETIYPGMNLVIPYAQVGTESLRITAAQGGSFDIWLYNPRNGSSSRLTNWLGEQYSEPYWSPDSKKIAFIGKNEIVYVVDLESGSTARIDQISPNTLLDWSPNSMQLSYVKGNQIVLYHVNTNSARKLNQPDANDVQWFPSGDELLFKSNDSDGTPQFYRIQTDGMNKRQITQFEEASFFNVRLSPDGSYALYTGPGVRVSLVTTVNIATGATHTLQGGPLEKNYNPEWSSNSERTAYSATFYPESGYYSYIQMDDRNGRNLQTSTISDCFSSDVTWSPDKDKIAYISGCQNAMNPNEAWGIDVSHPVPIHLFTADRILFLKWSPSQTASRKKTYRNKVYQVLLRYPADWQLTGDKQFE
ncbi:TolB protein [Virgibacillus natechei]|uniref:TolB protein n=1 Tax=Virgibacillus natechei TaxID=1216297 RepID=A0ABS4IL22_9BACI|nr:LysM peptidoglycan-binding domain-containing protein [Virgibacillus natechei]MBP1971659.1 TolB protein [Virgibacillus natechei]UZD13854.1 LysM peptidoglycan-binding domain-containing protein [Virgibacillus natechei]